MKETKNSTVFVKDMYRTNPLSLQDGGHTVEIAFEGGLTLVYDRIKNPRAYVNRIKKEQARKVVNVYVDGQLIKTF
jgi:hypothetical protein